MTNNSKIQNKTFKELNLPEPILKALDDVGYEISTPIQSEIIPYMFSGRDVLGQAQTGTGKTAAFALPLLSTIELKKLIPQVLVLTPTRELAIQVAEAFQKYATYLKDFHVMPIYGGQSYSIQLRQLKRGVHVVVGTPGRIIDHIKRETLNVSTIKCLVLDEADEMLRMGFIDDVKWIFEQTPNQRQVALFSATLPTEIRKIAQKYLKNPQEVTIKLKTSSADTIRQRYWTVSNINKLDALTRILESEESDGIIIFVRTKTETTELADKLQARGYTCAAINGDMAQKLREKTVEDLKASKLDILVATDVAARGLDVKRISHVINYDIPTDIDSYIHRIGRTGRAGRAGDAILFVSPRERRMLSLIQNATGKKIDEMVLPSRQDIYDLRMLKFKQKIVDTIELGGLEFFTKLLEDVKIEKNLNSIDIASSLAKLLYETDPLLFPSIGQKKTEIEDEYKNESFTDKRVVIKPSDEADMIRYKIEVGRHDGVRVGSIINIIATEAGLDGSEFGRIDIHEEFSTVDLPDGMPKDVFKKLQKVTIAGKPIRISKVESDIEITEKVRDSRTEGQDDRRRTRTPNKNFRDKKQPNSSRERNRKGRR